MNDVFDFSTLATLNDEDLKSLGFKLGQRRRIQAAVMERLERDRDKKKQEKEKQKKENKLAKSFFARKDGAKSPKKYRTVRSRPPPTRFSVSAHKAAEKRFEEDKRPHPNADYFLGGRHTPKSLIDPTPPSDFIARHARILLNPPATKIQTWWRSIGTKTMVVLPTVILVRLLERTYIRRRLLRERQNFKFFKASLVKLQAKARSWQVRRSIIFVSVKALIIQRAYRGHVQTLKLSKRFQTILGACLKVQALVRCHQAIRSYKRQRNSLAGERKREHNE